MGNLALSVNIYIVLFTSNNMPFKALNNKEEEKAERSYIYSHTTKHLTLLTKGKRSQSALEYMMTYGWAT